MIIKPKGACKKKSKVNHESYQALKIQKIFKKDDNTIQIQTWQPKYPSPWRYLRTKTWNPVHEHDLIRRILIRLHLPSIPGNNRHQNTLKNKPRHRPPPLNPIHPLFQRYPTLRIPQILLRPSCPYYCAHATRLTRSLETECACIR